MSAQAEPGIALERLRAARVSAYLAKPFGLVELTTALECQATPC